MIFNSRNFSSTLWLATVGALITLLITTVARYNAGKLGLIGIDNDDLMRLVQVRDFMNGQSWFIVDQFRLGPEGGTQMHWSRLVDVPLIALISLFQLFVTTPMAEKIALSVWPPLSGFFLLVGLLQGAKQIAGVKALPWALIVGVLALIQSHRFKPGSLDHHNIQFALLMMSLGFMVEKNATVRSFAVAGAAAALSACIGAETYLFVATLCVALAIKWLVGGSAERSRTIAFALTFTIIIIAAFFLTTSPMRYWDTHCDSLSSATVLLGGLSAGGFAFISWHCSHQSITARAVWLILLAATVLGVAVLYAPECLANPLDSLPRIMIDLWLSTIREAQPFVKYIKQDWTIVVYSLGIIVVTTMVCARELFLRRDLFLNLVVLALIAISAVLFINQIRFRAFANIFCLLPIAIFAYRIFVYRASRSGFKILPSLLFVVMTTQIFWLIPVVLANKEIQNSEKCSSDSIAATLKGLPTGRVLAAQNDAPFILAETRHNVLTGNYHRNIAGITAALEVATLPTKQAENILRKLKVDYVVVCFKKKADPNSSTLFDDILQDNVPDFLTSLSRNKADEIVIFKTKIEQ